MSGLEQAIRNALERADRANPEIRSRIYQSARNALDAGLRKQEVDDSDVIARQKHRLEQTIQGIEDEELERLRMIARMERVIDAHDESLEEAAPDRDDDAIEAENASAEPEANAPDRSRPHDPDDPEAEALPAETPVAAPVYEGVVRRIEPDLAAEPAASLARSHGEVEPAGRAEPDLTPLPAEPTTEAEAPATNPAADDAGSLDGIAVDRRQKPSAKAEKKRRKKREEESAAWAEPSTPVGRKVGKKKREKGRRAGSFFISLFVYAVLIAIVAGGVWWVYATGMLNAALNGSGDFDLIPKELQGEDFDPNEGKNPLDPAQKFSGEWRKVYEPDATNGIRARQNAKITDTTDSDGKAVILASGAPDQEGDILIDVPADILRDLTGRASTLALTMRSIDDKPAQIYVQCEFGSLGGCGRHRFTVTPERVDNLIQLQFDRKLSPDEGGQLVINTDLTGEGRAVKLYGIRVLPGT